MMMLMLGECVCVAGWPSHSYSHHLLLLLSQRALNKAALAVLRCSKSVWEWGQTGVPIKQRRSFFDRIGLDIEIVKVVLLLTGSFQGTKNLVAQYLATFHKYDWLWKEDMEATYKRFMERDPQIEHFGKQSQQPAHWRTRHTATDPLTT